MTWTDSTTLTDKVKRKYAAGINRDWQANWGLQSVRRLELWGFNTLSEYSSEYAWPGMRANWNTTDGTMPDKMPFLYYENPSLYSLTNAGNYAKAPVKDILNGVKSQYLHRLSFAYHRCVRSQLRPRARWLASARLGERRGDWACTMTISSALIWMNPTTRWGSARGPTSRPSMTRTPDNWMPATPCRQTAWLVLVTDPMQAANHSLNVNYSNKTVFSKQAMSTYFSKEYGGKIAALNAAWGSNYTTFGTTDLGGTAAIQIGTYASFGAGHGLLDEDGTCPSRSRTTAAGSAPIRSI